MMASMPPFHHLVVHRFLASEIDARALKCALDIGLIDRLAHAPASEAELARSLDKGEAGMAALCGLLASNNVLARDGGALALNPAFLAALAFRDLIELRIDFADQVWPDIHEFFAPLLFDTPQFMARSRTFSLFRYDLAMNTAPEQIAATRAWTRLTTGLTKYEARAPLALVDLAEVETLVDLGGNTGEFSRRLCEARPALSATVVDLPAVCAIGRAHLDADAAPQVARRVAFHPADMRRDALPAPADLVTLKSVLHDWPPPDAAQLIARAAGLVRPGGRLMIFERAPLDFAHRRITYALAPDLVFLHFLRPEALYLTALANCGLQVVECRRVALEVDFHLIVARRPGGRHGG
jgi:SAM-dependent methyltransferase